MYISEQYKEGVIYEFDGAVLTKIRCRVQATDETIYNSLKKLTPLIECVKPSYRINTVFKNILDEKPVVEIEKPDETLTYTDSIFTVPANEYTVKNVILTDQDVYGDNFDGKNRRVRIIWKDKEGTEQLVPLASFDDEDQAKNPHGAYSYNSIKKQLIFEQFRPYETQYILRRYEDGTK